MESLSLWLGNHIIDPSRKYTFMEKTTDSTGIARAIDPFPCATSVLASIADSLSFYLLEYSSRLVQKMTSQSPRPGINYTSRLNNYLQERQQIHSLSWVDIASPQGPRAVIWVVHCKVDGEIRGTGEGMQKSVAREAAAQQVYEWLRSTPE